jgi:hypothetical protein
MEIKLFNKLNPFVFFLSFCFGIFICYITSPQPQIIIKYPTPENSGIYQYIDKASNCFKYVPQKIKCPIDNSQIKLD